MLERHLSSSERHVNDILKRNTVINKLKLKKDLCKNSNRKKTFKEQQYYDSKKYCLKNISDQML